MNWDERRVAVLRLAALVAASTVVLAAAFVGVLAVLAGDVAGFGTRLPVYVLAMAVAFVTTVVYVERGAGPPAADGRAVLATTAGVACLTFLVVALFGEGVTYAVRYPGRVLASTRLLYVLAGGLLATGLGYWALRHWREFTADATASVDRDSA